MKYGYARVSTRHQYEKGNSIEAQREQLIQAGAEKIYEDDFTGTKVERPQFSILLGELQAGDTLIVTKLDRFARSFWDGKDLIAELLDKGVNVSILNIGEMNNTITGKAIRNMFFVFAELERDLIMERTREGLRRAKTANPDFKVGRKKKFKKAQIEHAIELLKTHTYKEVEEITSISKSTLIREKKLRSGQ